MNDLPELSRGDGVPPRNPRLHWIETSDANTSIRFRVWSPAIWQIWTHFTGRTKPCFKNHDLCEGGHDESTLRWYGFLFGWHEVRNGPSFVQLTLGAARLLEAAVAQGTNYRGMIVTVSRGRSKKGPQLIKVDRYNNTGQENMGHDIDPLLSVYRMWHVKHLGHAARLSLVTEPADLPTDATDDGCLKTHSGVLSIKEGESASRTKRGSNKRKTKREAV